jgi:ferrous-iron efflux pump FieF
VPQDETPKKLESSNQMAKLMRLATYASVTVAAILIVVKIGAWLATESVSLLSSLVDSLLDAGSSSINLFAIIMLFSQQIENIDLAMERLKPLRGWHRLPSSLVQVYL